MIRKEPNPIPRDGQSSSRVILRRDHAHLQLPDPVLARGEESRVFEFLDVATERLSDPQACESVIHETMRGIFAATYLARQVRESDSWHALIGRLREHPIRAVLHEDAFTRRAFEKPRGYAGDAELLDYIYGAEQLWPAPPMSALGQRIFRETTNSGACNGVKARRGFIADFIDEIARRNDRPHALSVASGHVREADISSAVLRRQLGRLVALDSDAETLELVDRCYGKFGVETTHENAKNILTGRFDSDAFDLVYSAGLLDYLKQPLAGRLTQALFEKVRPGGHLLVVNFLPNIEVVGYMEAFMDWNLIYRDRIQMAELTSRIPEVELADMRVHSNRNRNVIYLVLQKA